MSGSPVGWLGATGCGSIAETSEPVGRIPERSENPCMERRELPQRTVFVAAMGRSGATRIAKLLDRSPIVRNKHEPEKAPSVPWFRGILGRLDPSDGNDRHRDRFNRALEQAFRTRSLRITRQPDPPKAIRWDPAWRSVSHALRAWRKANVYGDSCAEPERIAREVYERAGIHFDHHYRRFDEASTSRHLDGFHDAFKDRRAVADLWCRNDTDRSKVP
jgi:hypothetical protein